MGLKKTLVFSTAINWTKATKMKKAKSVSKLDRFDKFLVLVAIAAALFQFLVIRLFILEGTSMNPTLDNKESVIVNKLAYLRLNLKYPKYFLPFIDGTSNDGAFYFVPATRRGDIVVASPNARVHALRCLL